MRHRVFFVIVATIVAVAIFSGDAYAWGPRAQRAITGTSIQVVRRSMRDVFRSPQTKYDSDVIKGALAGPAALRDSVGITTENRLMHRIEAEMLLLRHARNYSAGSYFAYRAGVLSALVSDMFLPFMLDTSVEGRRLAEQIRQDIDEHMNMLTYVPARERPMVVRNLRQYLERNRRYMRDAEILIQTDYTRGDGFDGYLANGGAQNAFTHAVQAVSDILYTVVQIEEDLGYLKPSDESLTWYFVDNIEYLLKEKNNPQAAETIYDYFVRVNPGIHQAYEQIGDMYYEFGDKERAVQEWTIALESRGPDRPRIVRKVANYYIERGDELVARAAEPDPPANVLQDALVYFNRALGIDRGNEVAASAIHQTRVEQRRRDEREQTDREIVSAAETALAEANVLAERERLGEALDVYQRAVSLFDNVSVEFRAQREQAERGKRDAQGHIRRVVTEIIHHSQSLIEEGDRAIDEATREEDFDAARRMYQNALAMLRHIPDDQSRALVESRDTEVERAEAKLNQVDREKERWREDQERRRQLEQQRREHEAAQAAARAQQTSPGDG